MSINSYVFVDVLSDLAKADDVIVTDVGFSYQCTHQGWKTKKGQRILSNNGLAPMGWGLPGAIGAAFGSGRRVLLLTGEGGLMFNIQELATVAHHKLPIKIFVYSNYGYATIKQTQEFGFDKRLMGVNEDTGLSFPDFMKIAAAHKIAFGEVKDHEQLPPMINLMLMGDGPAMLEVFMSPDQPQAPRFLNRRNADGTMNPTPLEDSFPFLPEDEVAAQMDVFGPIHKITKTTWRYK